MLLASSGSPHILKSHGDLSPAAVFFLASTSRQFRQINSGPKRKGKDKDPPASSIVLGLGTRKSDSSVYVVFEAPRSWQHDVK